MANLYCFCTVLFYAFYDLWIVQRSGNANFFFAINLLYGLAQGLLVTDVLRAKSRYELDRARPDLKRHAVASVYNPERKLL